MIILFFFFTITGCSLSTKSTQPNSATGTSIGSHSTGSQNGANPATSQRTHQSNRNESLEEALPRIGARNQFSERSSPLILYRVIPDEGSTSGGQHIIIIGNNSFIAESSASSSETRVTVGGVPCTSPMILSARELYCILGSSNSPGTVNVEVYNHRRHAVLPRSFTYVSDQFNIPNFDPILTELPIASSSEHPAPVFRPFANSEAQILQNAWNNRISDHEWQHEVIIRGVRIGIENSDIPRPQIDLYIINDSNLAHEVGVRQGAVLTQEQVIASHAQGEILNGIMDGLVTVQSGEVNPAYHERQITPQEHAYINFLRNQINQIIQQLNEIHDGYYLNPASYDGTAYVNGDYAGENSITPNNSAVFNLVMYSIQINNEDFFIHSLVDFATLFNAEHTEAKSATIDAFTFLFVTKEFNSEGIRQNYLHFILRCGHIH